MTDTGVDGQRMAHPWLVSFGTAFLVALLGAVLVPLDDRTFAFAWGSHFGTLLLPAAGVGLLLRFRAWPWWVAVGTAVVVFAVVLVGISMMRAALARTSEPDAGGGVAEVTAPEQVGEWRRQHGAEARRLDRAARDRLDAMPEGIIEGAPALGVYGRGSDSVGLMTYSVGGPLADDFASDPEQGALDFLAGATGDDSPERIDPGPLGGGAACADEVGLAGAFVCGWADAETVGQVTLVVHGLTIEDAAPIVQLFREAATTGGAG